MNEQCFINVYFIIHYYYIVELFILNYGNYKVYSILYILTHL